VVLLLRLAVGGIALGLLWAFGTIFFVSRVYNDSLTETTLVVASAFLLFYVAEDLCEVSGVLAVVTLGAAFVWVGNAQITPEVRHSVHEARRCPSLPLPPSLEPSPAPRPPAASITRLLCLGSSGSCWPTLRRRWCLSWRGS
jgi:hypothetical protein